MKPSALLVMVTPLVLIAITGGGRLRADDAPDAPLPTDDPKAVAFYQACAKNDLADVKELFGSGAPIDGEVGKLRYTPLIIAACNSYMDVVNFLIDHRANLDLADSEGSTALLHSCWEDKPAAAVALINAGEDVNKGSNWARTPLMYAAKAGDDQIVQALIAHKVNLEATCDQGPAINWAAADDHLSVVKLLGNAGANPNVVPGNADSVSPLGYAVEYGDGAMIDYLIGIKADVNELNGSKYTPLMLAVNWDHPEAVARLLAHGARTDGVDRNGLSPLMKAAAKGADDIVQELINARADVNATDAHGETALTLAGDEGELGIVKMLKDAGAKKTDVHIIAREGTGPRLSRRQAWALAVAAIFVQVQGDNPHDLGGDRNDKWSQATLQQNRNVTDTAGLVKVLDDLRDHGDRTLFREEGAKLDQMSDADFTSLIAAHPEEAGRTNALRASYRKWKDRTGLAYDLCREANFINYGFAAGYLNANESWARLMEIARSAQANFSSWRELSDNFLDGREIMMGQRDPQFEACAKLLLDPQEPNSPWNQCPWKTEFPAENSASTPALSAPTPAPESTAPAAPDNSAKP